MTREEYNKIPAVNFSLLKYYMQSPAHFKYAFENQEEDVEASKALQMGKAIHSLILEPEKFKKEFTFIDFEERPVKMNSKGGVADYRTKANVEWKAFMKEAAVLEGKTMLDSKEDYEAILQMGEAVKSNKAAAALLKECKNEEVIQWTDPESGVKCKAIVDFNNIEKRMNGDLKSMESAAPYSLSTYMQKWSTHVQLAFYSDGLEQIHKVPFNTSFIIAIEKKAPFVCQPFFIDERAIEHGRIIYKRLLMLHRECVDKNKWGSYDTIYEGINGVLIANLPAWAYAQAENNEMFQQ